MSRGSACIPSPPPGYSGNVYYPSPVCPPAQPPQTEITVSTPETNSYSKWSIGIGIFVIILLMVGFFFVIFHLFRTETNANRLIAANTTGTPCSGQTCGVGFYCDGNGVCQVGSGEGISQACGSDADCTFGLKCLTTTHVCGVDNNQNPTSNFQNQQLTTTINGVKQYLVVDPTGSFLSPNKPANYSFDYSTKNGLRFRSTSPIYNGRFVGYNQEGRLIITSLVEDLKMRSDRAGNHQILNPICKTSNGGQALYYIDNASGSTVGLTTGSALTNLVDNVSAGNTNSFVDACPRRQIFKEKKKKCRSHRRRNCQLCNNLQLDRVDSRTISRVMRGRSSGSDTVDQIIQTVQQNQASLPSTNLILPTVNTAID